MGNSRYDSLCVFCVAGSVNAGKMTALMAAARGGHDACVKALLNAGAAVSLAGDGVVVQGAGGSAVLHAAEAGSVSCLMMLMDVLKGHVPQEVKDAALHRAAEAGSAQCMTVMLDAGADVNGIVDTKGPDRGSTVLLKATKKADYACVKSALKAGAEVNQRNIQGYTSLCVAAQLHLTALIELLLGVHDVDINAAGASGATALMLAAGDRSPRTPGNGPLTRLITAGADLNLRDRTGRTAVTCAAEIDRFDRVRTLVEAGADGNGADLEGETALIKAVEHGHLGDVRVLIQAGAKLNEADIRGETALMKAGVQGDAETVGVLIEAGASVNSADLKGETALIKMVKRDMRRSVHAVVSKARLDADVNARDKKGRSALMYAAAEGYQVSS